MILSIKMNYLTILDLHTRADIHSIQVYMDGPSTKIGHIHIQSHKRYHKKFLKIKITQNYSLTTTELNNNRIKSKKAHEYVGKNPQILET